MLLSYNCKKTGQTVDVDSSLLPVNSTEYLVRRGFREYMDNYHAGVTVKEHGADKCRELVEPMVTEAIARLEAGDIPGERAAATPEQIRARKMTATLVSAGVTDEDFAKILAMVEKSHKKAA